MTQPTTIAGVQMDVALGKPQQNIEQMLGKLDDAAAQARG